MASDRQPHALPTFESPEHERRHRKQRLAAAFRLFGQFGFDEGPKSQHLPHHASANSALYTGTHDNDTSAGWFATLKASRRAYTLRYLDTDAAHVPMAMIRAAQASVAQLVIAPLQDVLGLGSQARMNFRVVDDAG